jgi:SAM-dependent methyltransferase
MKSNTRLACEAAITFFSSKFQYSGKGLYVGIAGDPKGGEYSSLFTNVKFVTFDKDERWKPDVIGDITRTEFLDSTFDLVVCVQVIEHVDNIFAIPEELNRITKPGGYVIIDCPWMFKYHAEPPSFKDYWRISPDGFAYLFKQFKLIESSSNEYNTSCLFQKPI